MYIFIIATLAAMFVKGLIGFGNTLVFDSISAYGANNVDISPVEIVLTYPSNVILVLRNWRKMDYHIWLPTASLVLVGSFAGINLLRSLDAHLVKIIFAIFVIIMSIKMFIDLRRGESRALHGPLRLIFELLAGLIFGMYGVGTLVAIGMGKNTRDSESFKVNLNMVFVVETSVRMILYIFYGIITWETFQKSLFLYPFMLLAIFLGMKTASYLKESTIKYLVVFFLLISGISLLISNL